jgi:enoyl-CoA hydratase/carnithine racemase
MTYSCFSVSIENAIAHISLKRGEKLNTMIPEFWHELPEIINDIDANASARVIVLSAEGKHFSAGMDLSVFAGLGSDVGQEIGRVQARLMRSIEKLQDSFTCLEHARLPVLVAVQGACIGAGLDLVCACDMRYCTQDAFFTIQEINLGMTADVGTFPRLTKLLPDGPLRELAYTGRKLDADRAKRLGFVNETFDTPDEMMAVVMETAREIAGKSPLAIWGTKEMILYARDHSTADSLKHVATWQAGMFQEEDMREGISAQIEKRAAEYDDLLADKDLF